jgi:hypothetical protein
MNTEFIIIDTPLKHQAHHAIGTNRKVIITTENPDGKAIDHTFNTSREAIEFIDEFYRTASREEEIYIAQ